MLRTAGRLRRITSDGRWIPEIDSLRFVAIMSVVLFHLFHVMTMATLANTGALPTIQSRYEVLTAFLLRGDRGVPLFFMISGFVLGLPFARQFLCRGGSVSIRKYFVRRLTRIEPPYLLCLLGLSALTALSAHAFTADNARHTLASMLYLHNLFYGYGTPINPVAWSLEVEIQFYILAPLFMQVYRLRRKAPRRTLLAVLILGVSLAQSPLGSSPRASLSLAYFLQFFIMGILLADIYVLDVDRIRVSQLWDAVGALGLIYMFGIGDAFFPTRVAMPWIMALVCAGAVRGTVFRIVFTNRWIAIIGGMCYSIYLVHVAVIVALSYRIQSWISPRLDLLGAYAVETVLAGGAVLLFSTLFYLWVERPCMDQNWPAHLMERFVRLRSLRGRPAE